LRFILASTILCLLAGCSQQQSVRVEAKPAPQTRPTPESTFDDDMHEAVRRMGIGDYDGAKKYVLRARGKIRSADPPVSRELTDWDRAQLAMDSIAVGNSYDEFIRLRLDAITPWCSEKNRTDFADGSFSQTYKIVGRYVTFHVRNGRFTTVSKSN